MQNSFLKLTAVAGIIGICFLVILQVQRGLSRPGDDTGVETALDETVDLGDAADLDVMADSEPAGQLPLAQSEPEFTTNTEPEFDQFSDGQDSRMSRDDRGRSQPAGSARLKAVADDEDPAFADFEAAGDPGTADTMSDTSPGGRGIDFRDDGSKFSAGAGQSAPLTSGEQPRLDENDPFGEFPDSKSTRTTTDADTDAAMPEPLGKDTDPFGFTADTAEQTPAGATDGGSTTAPRGTVQPARHVGERPNPLSEGPGPAGIDRPENKRGVVPAEFDETASPRRKPAPELPFEGAEGDADPGPQLFAPNLEKGQISKQTTKDPDHAGVPETVIPPKPLNPAPGAMRLVPPGARELNGDGTLDRKTPRGPQRRNPALGKSRVSGGEQRPQLKIEKSAPANAVLGQPMVYKILVKNVGDSTAYQVVVKDQIPKGSKLTGTIPQAEMSGRGLQWQLGSLKPGEEQTISVRVVPTAEGQIGSVATVNFVAEVAAKALITAPKLQLELKSPQQVKLGETVVLHFKVSNIGTGDATGVTIRDLLPKGLKHPSGSDLEYEIGTLAAGTSRDVKLTITAAEPGVAMNRAVVTGDGGLSTEAKTALNVLGNRLKVTRIGPQQRYLGRPAVYENRVTNDSRQTVTDVAVIETLPPGVQFVEASSGGQYHPQTRTIAWRIDKIGAGETVAVRVTLVPQTRGTQTSVVKAIVR